MIKKPSFTETIKDSITETLRREPREKIKVKWFSRLRVEILIFTVVAIAGALVVSLLLVLGINIIAKAISNDALEQMPSDMAIIFDDLESYIIENDITPDDIEDLEERLNQYDQYFFQITMGKPEELIEFFRTYEDAYFSSLEIGIKTEYINAGKLELSTIQTSFSEYEQSRSIITNNGFFVIESNYKPLVVFSQKTDQFFLVLYLILFVMIFSIYINRKLRNLVVISKGLDQMQGGDLNHEIKVKGKDEIAQVAWHINEMSISLQERIVREQLIEHTKNQLIANVSHDLRTPLTSITGYLALLKEQTMVESEEAKNYIDICYKKADNLNHLVDQLFDYVLLTNHQLDIDKQRLDINVFVSQIMDELELLLSDHGFSVSIETSKEPVYSTIDPRRFMRVFENLVTNVVKYGDNNVPVKVIIKNRESVEIHMINATIKTLAMEEEQVFERYFTSNRIDGRSGGLGLAICKQIVEQHDGDISFSLGDGFGHIIITLPKA